MKTYYVGMDVHRASIVIVVLNGAGKVVMRSVIETGAERVRGFLKQLRGKVYVTFTFRSSGARRSLLEVGAFYKH